MKTYTLYVEELYCAAKLARKLQVSYWHGRNPNQTVTGMVVIKILRLDTSLA